MEGGQAGHKTKGLGKPGLGAVWLPILVGGTRTLPAGGAGWEAQRRAVRAKYSGPAEVTPPGQHCLALSLLPIPLASVSS